MALTVTHSKVSAIPDGTDTSVVRPSDWNANHVISGSAATGAGGDAIFFENGQTVTTDYTITTNYNAGSFGPVTINSGITVTVPSGSVWTIV